MGHRARNCWACICMPKNWFESNSFRLSLFFAYPSIQLSLLNEFFHVVLFVLLLFSNGWHSEEKQNHADLLQTQTICCYRYVDNFKLVMASHKLTVRAININKAVCIVVYIIKQIFLRMEFPFGVPRYSTWYSQNNRWTISIVLSCLNKKST